MPGHHRSITGTENIDKSIHVDQSPIGRTPRSNPATYTGVFDRIRKLFAETPEAKVRGYQPGRFSFNVKGGRCENCAGEGTIKIEMNFLPDVYVPCEVPRGPLQPGDLEVRYKGKTIAEVLDLPIEDALEFFARSRRSLVTCALWSMSVWGMCGWGSRRPPSREEKPSGSNSLPNCSGAPPGEPSMCSTSRPRACISRTSDDCSKSCNPWSTRAIPWW